MVAGLPVSVTGSAGALAPTVNVGVTAYAPLVSVTVPLSTPNVNVHGYMASNSVVDPLPAVAVAAVATPATVTILDPLPQSTVIVAGVPDTVTINEQLTPTSVVVTAAQATVVIIDSPVAANQIVVAQPPTPSVIEPAPDANVIVAAGHDVDAVMPGAALAAVNVQALGFDTTSDVNVIVPSPLTLQAQPAELLGPSLLSGGSYVQGPTPFFSGSTTYTSHALTFASNVTAGNVVILAVGWGGATAISSVTDSQGGTAWSHVGAFNLGGYDIDLYWKMATQTGSMTVTTTFSGPSDYVRLLLHEYSGFMAYEDATETFSYGNGNSTPTSSFTVAHPNSLVFSWLVDNTSATSFNSPMTTRQTVGSEITGDDVNAGAGTYTVSATTAGTGAAMLALVLPPLKTVKYLQDANNFSGAAVTSLTVALPFTMFEGSLIVLAGECSGGTFAPTSITDTMGNTFTALYTTAQDSPSSDFAANMWYAPVNGYAGGDTITISLSAARSFIRIWAVAYSGVDLLDQKSTTMQAISTSPFSGSITAMGSNEVCAGMVIANSGVGSGGTPASGPFTTVSINNVEVFTNYLPTAPGTYTASYYNNGTDDTMIMLGSFMPAGAAPTTVNVNVVAYAPSVTIVSGTFAAAGVGAVAVAALQPTAHVVGSPPVVNVAVAALAPAVSLGHDVAVTAPVANVSVAANDAVASVIPTAAATSVPVAANQPLASVSLNVAAALANVTVAALAPTITASGSAAAPIVNVAVGALVPTTISSVTVTPPVANVTVAGLPASVSISLTVTAPVTNVTVAVYTPTVALGGAIVPQHANVTVAAFNPTVALSSVATPIVAPIVVVGLAGTVTVSAVNGVGNVTVGDSPATVAVVATPQVANVTVGVPAPTIGLSGSGAPQVANVAVAAYNATVLTGVGGLAQTANVTVTAPNAGAALGATVTPQVATVTVAGLDAGISADAFASPVVAAITVTAIAPVVTVPALVLVTVRTSTALVTEVSSATTLTIAVQGGTQLAVAAVGVTEDTTPVEGNTRQLAQVGANTEFEP
jgi:hypothetical protein